MESSVAYSDASDLSGLIISLLVEEEEGGPTAIVALALTLMRVASPFPLSNEEEERGTQQLVDWLGNHFKSTPSRES